MKHPCRSSKSATPERGDRDSLRRMFHVKHSAPDRGDPKEIGRRTRSLVEDYLREIGFAIPNAGFADRIERFATTLAQWGRRTNLTARPEDPAEIAFHIIDSLAPLTLAEGPPGTILRRMFGPGKRLIDLGSGAGFPGLILAAACDAQVTLLEARRKRISFLRVAAGEMGLTSVTIGNDGETGGAFDMVVGRAFAKPAIFYRAAAAHVGGGGYAILFASREQRLDEAAAALAGLTDLQLLPYEIRRGEIAVSRLLAIWRSAN